jgi:hypothetical protein
MFRRLIAVSFVTFWLLLLGIDFSGDAGWIQQYRGSEMDRAVDSALTDYGQATKIISNEREILLTPLISTGHSAAFSSFLVQCVSTAWANKPNPFSREQIPLYKFHLVFLI